jgi:hypothetical protein
MLNRAGPQRMIQRRFMFAQSLRSGAAEFPIHFRRLQASVKSRIPPRLP